MSVLGELKRRKMFQVAVVYLVVAWLIMQIVDVIHTPLRLPEWFPAVVIVFLAIGFPIAMIISWAFNVTPGGLVRDAGGEESAKESGRTIEFVFIGLVAVAVLWLIYRTEFDEPPAEQPLAQEVVPDVLPNSVAVLPFANLSPDPDNAFFAAGIHDTILSELAKIRDRHVISRTTMMRYADTEKSMPRIAEELRVETVMEGSIQQQMTTSPESYAYYLQAMSIGGEDLSPGDDNPEVHVLLDKAIVADPFFARANAIKARLFATRPSGGALATEYAEKALELGPDLGLAHYALAYNHGQRGRDIEARQAFATALELSPNEPNIMDDAARYYANMGDFEAAIRLASRLHDIDPGFSSALAAVTWKAGDLDASLQARRQLVKFDPSSHNRRLDLAIIEHLVGNEEAALVEAHVAKSLRPDARFDDFPGYYIVMSAYRYRVLGLPEDADRLFDLFIDRAANGESVRPSAWAFAYAAIGDYEKMLEYLQLMAQEVDDGLRFGGNATLARNLYRDPMLETPEFIEVRKRLGFDLSDIL